jgi:multidrug efflux pump subunit AcrA (membrane-fusion protein)
MIMKKVLIITGVVVAIIALIVFNKLISKKTVANTFTEAKAGTFEITVINSGELIAEKSLEIKGPEIGMNSNQGHGQGGRGGDMHAMDLKIQDIIPEGTMVKEGDYIAQLDRTAYDNTLKTERENLVTQEANLEMKILDTAVVLTNLRDDIKNQTYAVEEASITLAQSKFEPPATIRLAEKSLDKAIRTLEMKKRGYMLRVAQTMAEIEHQELHVSRGRRLVTDLEDFLGKFTITAPSSGMVIYKKDRNGSKRKAGSTVNPFDRVIATLPDLSAMLSKVYINEIEISKVKPGLKAEINVDALPEKTFTGTVYSIANVGEQLPNSDSKMFEVQIKVEGSDPTLRPSMTTGNKIIIKTFRDAVFIPTECVHTGPDSIPFVYEKNRTRQIVLLGESNEKNVIVEKGLEPGTSIYVISPPETENFKLTGEELIATIRSR